VKILTRTRRIYNKRPIEGGPGFKGWITTEIKDEMLKSEKKWYNKSMRPEEGEDPFISRTPWMTYHPYRQVCCGNCPSCKDRMKSKRRRLAYKEELRRVSWMESDTYYFMWSWGYRDVQEGLFGEFLAERALQNLDVRGIH
jgi:hypothetical protein